MKGINKDQVLGALRHILTLFGTYFAIKWFKDANVWAAVSASAVAVVMTAWGIADKTNKGLSGWMSLARHLLTIGAACVATFLPTNKAIADIIAMLIGIVSIFSSTDANATPDATTTPT